METVFLTGITGLLGANLSRNLLNKGYYVKALLRDKNKFKGDKHENLELIQGGLFDDLSTAILGCNYVIHAAAETKQNIINYSEYWQINYNASIQIFNTAIKCNIKRFIYVSTANTMGYGTLQNPGKENDKMKSPFSDSFYAKSKMETETYLLNKKDKIEIAIINPTFMLGAYDNKPSSGKIILMGLNKKLIFCPPGGKNFVHVKDVTDAIIKSMNNELKFQRYLIGNENLSYFDFYQKLNTVTRQNSIIITIPKGILILLAYFGELVRKLNIKTTISLTNINILCTYNYFTNAHSIENLHIKYQTTEKAIADGVEYFKQLNIK